MTTGRLYSVTFEQVTILNADGTMDLISFLPATDKPVKLHQVVLAVTSELGDAEEEMLRIGIFVGATTQGTGGNAATGNPFISVNGADDAATVRTVDTTIATAGTEVRRYVDAFNVRIGWNYYPAPEHRIMVENAAVLAVRLLAAVADTLGMSGTALYEEVI
jgi:hypothetical protein